jgi:hypothetical protein
VQECAALMMTYSKAVYEIAYLLDADDKPVAFVLLGIRSNSVKAESGKLKQYIPENITRELELASDVIELSTDNFVTFELPAYMKDEYAPSTVRCKEI